MKKKHGNNKSAQSTIVYLVVIGVVAVALTAIGVKIRQKLEGSYKKSADVFDEGRQLGSFSTSVLPKFEFPVLPGGISVPVPPPTPIPPPSSACDDLIRLAQEAQQKEQEATDSMEEAGDAKTAALEMLPEVVAAESAYYDAKIESDAARIAADAAQADCDNCSPTGPLGALACQIICDNAAQLVEIAVQKEAITASKYDDWQTKLAEYNRLMALADAKMLEAQQAQADALAANQALEDAQKACYGL